MAEEEKVLWFVENDVAHKLVSAPRPGRLQLAAEAEARVVQLSCLSGECQVHRVACDICAMLGEWGWATTKRRDGQALVPLCRKHAERLDGRHSERLLVAEIRIDKLERVLEYVLDQLEEG
jgi:hypothetical protein